MQNSSIGKKPPEKLWAVLSVTGFIAVVAVNALANILPINNVNTGTLSDEIPNLFVPAGLTFSIWGLIYLMLAGQAVALLVEAFGKKPSGSWDVADNRIFFANMLANAAWIFAWQYRLVPLSLAIMLVILVTLIMLEERIYARRVGAAHSGAARSDRSTKARGPGALRAFFLSTPISIYLGWICVATIANVTAFLVKSGWNAFDIDPRIWTVIAIAAGTAVALLLSFLRGAVAAPLVVVWAYAGIVIKRTQVDSDFSRPVWIAAIAAAGLIVFVLVSRLMVARRSPGGA